jgi:hypothetical protein
MTKAWRGDQIFWKYNFIRKIYKFISLFQCQERALSIYMREVIQLIHQYYLCAVLKLLTFGFKNRVLLCIYVGLRCGNSVMKRYRSPIVTGVQIRRFSFSKEVPVAQRYNTRQFVLQPGNILYVVDVALTEGEYIATLALFIDQGVRKCQSRKFSGGYCMLYPFHNDDASFALL